MRAERQLQLLEKVHASPISDDTKQIVAHHVIGLVRNQTEKNTLIDAQITFEEPPPEGDAIEVSGENPTRQRLLDEG